MPVQTMERCTKCILPNTSNVIPFRSDKTCSLCHIAESHPPKKVDLTKAQTRLLECIEQIRKRGQGRPYDCIVGVSGGRDSTYLLYLLTQKHHLRCLAVYYRTPFTPELIDRNIRCIVKQLGCDLEEIQLSQEYHRRIAREMVLLWGRNPHRLIINMACAPCKLLNREIYRITTKHNVPTIVCGANIYEAVQIAASISKKEVFAKGSKGTPPLIRGLKQLVLLFWNGVKLLVATPKIWKYIPLGIRSSIMYISTRTLYLTLRYPKISMYDYFYEIPWNEKECDKTIKELGWERPANCNTNWRADCCFDEIKNILFRKTTGITYADAFFSNMVRAGVLSREEALERLKTEGRISPERIKDALKILELDENYFDKEVVSS